MSVIKEYLLSGKSLTDLKQEFNLYLNFDEKYPLVVFDYTMLSPKDSEITKEARGLILNTETYDVVSMSLPAFYEHDSEYSAVTLSEIDWNSSRLLSKYDGTQITLYHHNGEWLLGTRFIPVGVWTVYSINSPHNTITWTELFYECLESINISFESFTSNLDKNLCYTFEIATPKNKGAISYDKHILKLIGVVSLNDEKEVSIDDILASFEEDNYFRPEYFNVYSMDECLKYLEAYSNPNKYEGFVLVDKYFNRVKFRNKLYVDSMNSLSTGNEIDELNQINNNVRMFLTIPV
jgi:hypothetical protein